jgi:hypothetical protein
MRYLALGDSYTIGESVEPAQRWPAQLTARLRERGFALDDPPHRNRLDDRRFVTRHCADWATGTVRSTVHDDQRQQSISWPQ